MKSVAKKSSPLLSIIDQIQVLLIEIIFELKFFLKVVTFTWFNNPT